jgi:hypothetical protein
MMPIGGGRAEGRDGTHAGASDRRRDEVRGLWSSDAAKPHATLYSAILREITTKKGNSRFKKAARGQFALNA